ncbi:MAG: YraN family protein [Clostridia bacterium]|nr:YraN family protein [Clostridia bacterium]
MSYNRSLGAQGERDAADYLRGVGAKIIEMNYRCEAGEIDVIALLDDALVFCEVKRRKNALRGRPAEAVTPAKQRRIIRAAECWLASHPQPERFIRFDVLEILPGEFCHIPAAFDAST